MKILVVDDHVLIRDALREILKVLKNDAVVLETADCGQTMRLIEEHGDIELILLDLTLPDGSGLEMLAELRDDNIQLTANLREAHSLCEEHRDVASASLIEIWIDEAEKRTWFLFEATRHG